MKNILKYKYLILRRIIQISIILCFFVGANLGFNFAVGNLSSSLWFDTIPLSDPFAVLQLILASFGLGFGAISITVIIGALIILLFYALFAGRAFCAWVCPVNIISDFAVFFSKKLNIKHEIKISNNIRYYLLALSLVLSFILSTPIFESVSYIGIIQRGLILGTTAWLMIAFIIFVIDGFISPRTICSHICPLGAFYALVSVFSLVKIKYDISSCTNCHKCINICPEKQVLSMISKHSASVDSGECIRCGRCIEVCDDDALNFNIFNLRSKK